MVVVAPGAHSPSSAQAPNADQVHSVPQRSSCMPQLPQLAVRVDPGAQTPSASQAPYSHSRAAVQKRVRVPQLPQGVASVAPGVSQVSVTHSEIGSYSHESEHRRSRSPLAQPSPLRISAPGAHSPSPVHAPAASHRQALVQISRTEPQLPQLASRLVPG